MGQINWGRILLGGLLWALVHNLLLAASYYLFLKREWTAALEASGRPLGTEWFILFFLPLTVLVGIFALLLYAAIRPRYGPGPKTAVGAGVALWLILSLLPTIAWWRLLLFPARLLIALMAATLVMIVVATVVGAWPYKEKSGE